MKQSCCHVSAKKFSLLLYDDNLFLNNKSFIKTSLSMSENWISPSLFLIFHFYLLLLLFFWELEKEDFEQVVSSGTQK